MPTPVRLTRVYDIRGTHGSGKSHIVHELLRRCGNDPIYATPGNPRSPIIGHAIDKIRTVVIGPYTKVCGGGDAVKNQEEVCSRVSRFVRDNIFQRVILEGSLVGHTYSRYAALADEIGRDRYTFLFLTTPLEECIRRVEARRKARGNDKPLDPKNIIKDHACTQVKLYHKFTEAGYRTRQIPWEGDPVPYVLRQLGVV